MPARFEKSIPLKGDPRIATVWSVTLKHDQLALNQRFNVRTVQIARFTAVVDQKQHSEFMRTQHSCLRRVSF